MIIHNDLLKRGYRLKAMIPDKTLYHDLARVVVDLAAERCKDCRIIPGDIATEGSPYEFKERVHLVYEKRRKSKKVDCSVIAPFLRYKKSRVLTCSVNICREL